jgi:hypothetical protein
MYDCELVEDSPSCFKKPPAKALPESDVVKIVVANGDYRVTRRDDATIAGERAQCFAITARHAPRQLPGLGPEKQVCLARDGIALRTHTINVDSQDERNAVHVVRAFDAAALAPVLAGFETATPQISG